MVSVPHMGSCKNCLVFDSLHKDLASEEVLLVGGFENTSIWSQEGLVGILDCVDSFLLYTSCDLA